MSTMITVRIEEDFLAEIDRERRRGSISRSRVIKEALALWVERKKTEEAVRRDQQGYERAPVTDDEFGPVLGAQRWPK